MWCYLLWSSSASSICWRVCWGRELLLSSVEREERWISFRTAFSFGLSLMSLLHTHTHTHSHTVYVLILAPLPVFPSFSSPSLSSFPPFSTVHDENTRAERRTPYVCSGDGIHKGKEWERERERRRFLSLSLLLLAPTCMRVWVCVYALLTVSSPPSPLSQPIDVPLSACVCVCVCVCNTLTSKRTRTQ